MLQTSTNSPSLPISVANAVRWASIALGTVPTSAPESKGLDAAILKTFANVTMHTSSGIFARAFVTAAASKNAGAEDDDDDDDEANDGSIHQSAHSSTTVVLAHKREQHALLSVIESLARVLMQHDEPTVTQWIYEIKMAKATKDMGFASLPLYILTSALAQLANIAANQTTRGKVLAKVASAALARIWPVHKKQILAWFLDGLVTARDSPAPEVLAALAPALKLITADDLAQSPTAPAGSSADIMPSICRALRRSAPVVFVGCVPLFNALASATPSSATSSLIAPYVTDILTSLVAEFRASESARRSQAVKVAGAMARTYTAASVSTSTPIVSALANNLLGKEGVQIAPSVDSRCAIIDALALVASSLPLPSGSAKASAPAVAAVDALCESCNKDASSVVRQAALTAVTAILTQSASSLHALRVPVPASVSAYLSSSILAADTACTPAYAAHASLVAAVRILSVGGAGTAEMREKLADAAVLEKIAAVITTAGPRLVLRGTALAAAALALAVKPPSAAKKEKAEAKPEKTEKKTTATAAPAADKAKSVDKALGSGLQAQIAAVGSFVNNAEGIADASPEEASVHIALVASMLTAHVATITKACDKAIAAPAAAADVPAPAPAATPAPARTPNTPAPVGMKSPGASSSTSAAAAAAASAPAAAAAHADHAAHAPGVATGLAAGTEDAAAYPGFFRAVAQLLVSPSYTVRREMLHKIGPLLPSLPSSLGVQLLRGLAVVSGLAEAAESGNAQPGWPLRTLQKRRLTMSTTLDVQPTIPTVKDPQDIEPVYMAGWDGDNTFFSIRRVDLKAASFTIKSHKKRDPLRSHPRPSLSTHVWLKALRQLCVSSSPAAVAQAMLIAAHPLFTSSASSDFATVEGVASRICCSAGIPPIHSALKAKNDVANVAALLNHANGSATAAALAQLLFGSPSSSFSSSSSSSSTAATATASGWLASLLESRRRAGVVLLGVIATASPRAFKEHIAAPLIAQASRLDVFSITPYQLAVYRTPTGIRCKMEDPEEVAREAAKAAAAEKAAQAANRGKANTADSKWEEQVRKELEEKKKRQQATETNIAAAMAAETAAALKKEYAIRTAVAGIILPLEAALAGIECVAALAPNVAHSDLLMPMMPALHQLIRCAPISSTGDAAPGSRATVDADPVPVAGPEGNTLPRAAARATILALAKTLDLCLSLDASVVQSAALALTRVWEHSAAKEFGVLSNKVVLRAYADPRATDLIAMAAAVKEVAEAARDNQHLSAPSFAFILPVLDALLRFGPVDGARSGDDAENEEEDEEADEDELKSEEKDEENKGEGTSSSASSSRAYARALEDLVFSAVQGAVAVLAGHAGPAAASNNIHNNDDGSVGGSGGSGGFLTRDDANNRFPVDAMISLILASLARLPEVMMDERALLSLGLERIATSLTPRQLGVFVHEHGLMSEHQHVKVAVLNALQRVQVILARDSLTLAAQLEGSVSSTSSSKGDAAEHKNEPTKVSALALTTAHPSDIENAALLRETVTEIGVRIWILAHDVDEEVSETAKQTLKALSLTPGASSASASSTSSSSSSSTGAVSPDMMLTKLIGFLTNKSTAIRASASQAIYSLLVAESATRPDLLDSCMDQLAALYTASPDYTQQATSVRTKAVFVSRAKTRMGVATCFMACAPLLGKKPESLRKYYTFFLENALADLDDEVWESCLQAALKAVHLHGAEHVTTLSGIFRAGIDEPAPNHPASLLIKSKKGSAKPAPKPASEPAAPPPTNKLPWGASRTPVVAAKTAVAAPAPKQSTAAASKAAEAASRVLEDAYAQVDRLRESAVVLMGTLARYLPAGSPQLPQAIDILLSALDSPSQNVQKSVADCLVPLVSQVTGAREGKSIYVDKTVATLLETATTHKHATSRLGAAMAFAAIIKGLGGSSMKQYNVFDTLATHVKSKANHARHGALLLYQSLFDELGPLLSPYVTRVLPLIVPCFGESDASLRDAAHGAASAMMKHLTGPGVKLVTPTVIAGLDDKKWRTRIDSIELLASMTSLAPRELSMCLPQIMRPLLDAVGDAHPDVQAAAKDTIRRLASVVRNPEIRRLLDRIISALLAPTSSATGNALMELASTTFRHFVDAPSLAVVMPILRAGLRDREGNSKKVAAQITGALAQVVANHHDIDPYAAELLRYLKTLLMDSLPDTRRVAARALGAMANGSKNAVFAELQALLLAVLSQDNVKVPAVGDQNIYAKNGTTAVHRSGSAQGVAELLLVQEAKATHEVISLTAEKLKDSRWEVRDGFIQLIQAINSSFGPKFAEFLEAAFPLILTSLVDAHATCREAAVKTGQDLVIAFARTQKETLLRSLVDCLIEQDWRMRQGSMLLTASLILRLAGLSGKLTIADAEDDPAAQSSSSAPASSSRKEHNAIQTIAQERLVEDALGTDLRNDVYTSLYLMQCDVVPSVAQIAWRVWKAVAPSQTRTMTVILPSLMDRIIADLASWHDQRQLTAGAALGDLVSKLGDRVLQNIVPILLDKLTSHDPRARKGVCLGIAEVLQAGTKNALVNYVLDFIPAIKNALCDEHQEVRTAARHAFAALRASIGVKALREVIPAMLESITVRHEEYERTVSRLRSEGKSEAAIQEERDGATFVLQGLKEIFKIPSCEKEAVDLAVPHFIQPPITPFKAYCLSVLADALGPAFDRYVINTVESLVKSLAKLYANVLDSEEEEQDEEEEANDDDEEDSENKDAGDGESKAAEARRLKAAAALTPEAKAAAEAKAERKASEALLIASAEGVISGLGQGNLATIVSVLTAALAGGNRSGDDSDDEYDYKSDSENAGARIAASKLLATVVRTVGDAVEPHVNEIFKQLLPRLLDDVPLVNESAANAIEALCSAAHRDVLIKSVGFIRSRMNSLTKRDSRTGKRGIREIHGFSAGAVGQLIAVFQHGLVAGIAGSIRDQSSAGLADLADVAPAAALKPHVVKLTGPLIRSFGDRYSAEVRATILQTLGTLVAKQSAVLKAFHSQLQTTFVKGLHDEHAAVRSNAGVALANLMRDARRVDVVVTELLSSLRVLSDEGVRSSIAKVIRLIFSDRSIAERLPANIVDDAISATMVLLQSDVDLQRIEGAKIAGAMFVFVSDETAQKIAAEIIVLGGIGAAVQVRPKWTVRQSVAMAFSSIIMATPDRFVSLVGKKTAVRFLSVGFRDDNADACSAAVRLAGRLLHTANNDQDTQLVRLLVQELLALAATHSSEDVKLTALEQVSRFAEEDPSTAEDFNMIIIPGCIRARGGAPKNIRKEADTIMYFSLGFHEGSKNGFANAEAFSFASLSTGDAAEFMALCKRSVAKVRKDASDDKQDDE